MMTQQTKKHNKTPSTGETTQREDMENCHMNVKETGKWKGHQCIMGGPRAALAYRDGSGSPDPAITISCIKRESVKPYVKSREEADS